MMPAAPFFADLADGPDGGHALWLTAGDGVRLRVAVWPQGSKGTVLILTGRTESVEKYGRTAAELARRGYASLAIDWRGQGLSDRLTAMPMAGHVARFSDYQRDLGAVRVALDTLHLPQPLFLLAHSMGGTIALRALIDGFPVQAAAFTGPMWGIHIAPTLRPLAWAIATGARAAGRGLSLVPGTGPDCHLVVTPFDGNLLTTDAEMYGWMKSHVLRHPELGLGGPTLHWLHEALLECRRLRAAPSPAVPAVVFLGSDERIVTVKEICRRMGRWPGGTLELVPKAAHEVLMETPAIRARAFDRIAALFDAQR